MTDPIRIVLILLACLLIPGSTALVAQTETDDQETQEEKRAVADASGFIRIRRDVDGKPQAMQTSVTRYEVMNDDGEIVTVDLIGVVHIGEQKYYEDFNKLFEQYDAMLYELVAEEGTVIPKGGGGSDRVTNPIAALQLGMKQQLGLEFQLEHIDYTKDNFVHADMTPAEFAESMKNNDEGIGKMLLRAIGSSMARQSAGQGDDMQYEMLKSMITGEKSSMRQAMASQMQDIESGMIIFEGRDGSTIIDHRNAKAMEVLKREMDAGKKRLALFYGAGHLPDMESRLLTDFEMKRGGRAWMDAWNLAPEEKEPVDPEKESLDPDKKK